MKRLLAVVAALAIFGGISMASAQTKDGRPADEKNVKSQSEERGPSGTTGASTKNPSPTHRRHKAKRHHHRGHHVHHKHHAHHRGHHAHRQASKDGRPADERTPKAQGEERNPNGTTGGSQTKPSR